MQDCNLPPTNAQVQRFVSGLDDADRPARAGAPVPIKRHRGGKQSRAGKEARNKAARALLRQAAAEA